MYLSHRSIHPLHSPLSLTGSLSGMSSPVPDLELIGAIDMCRDIHVGGANERAPCISEMLCTLRVYSLIRIVTKVYEINF